MTFTDTCRRARLFTLTAVLGITPSSWLLADETPMKVDFRYAPQHWQTAICLPDDPQKSLVDDQGTLLYDHYGRRQKFAVQVSVVVADDARWVRQTLLSPRVPIVQTWREAEGLEILEEAFAVTDLTPRHPQENSVELKRVDGHDVQRNWAQPGPNTSRDLADIAVHFDGPIKYSITTQPGAAVAVAMALCEGWHAESGQRIEVLRVEGAALKTVDTVADLGKNRAGAFWFDAKDVNRDGQINIVIEAAEEARDKNTILNKLWVFAPTIEQNDTALLTGKLDDQALAIPGTTPRNDIVFVQVTNGGTNARTVHPTIDIYSLYGLDAQLSDGQIVVGSGQTVTASLAMRGIEETGKNRHRVRLAPLTIEPGKTATFSVLYSGGKRRVIYPSSVDEALACRQKAVAYWQNAPLPWNSIQIPDPQIQAVLDSSVRNIWQAREIKNELPAFQVGPTCYRGLWIVDGAFLLEAATMVGTGDQARAGLAYMLSFQKPDGRFEIIRRYHKENGIVIWACTRHALLTQDRGWLESIWPQLEKTATYIKHLRQETYNNKTTLDDGLIPPGFPDGGIGGKSKIEYTNVYWNLVGLKAFIDAAHWLGKDQQAQQWQQEYDDFYATFRKAAARDLREDAQGNKCLPILMGTEGDTLPLQKGQWAFCHAVHPGQIFAKRDSLVEGNLAMLKATEREGMVMSTGWMTGGIWNYFAAFYGHAWLWQGDGQKAAECLYAFANHASPLLAWREEQPPKDARYRMVGDMPHNWASAEFIRLTVHMLALDRGNELHLFEGLPQAWTQPGMITKLDGIATRFGSLTMELKIHDDGKSATLSMEPLSDTSCEKIVVHLGGWASQDPSATIALDPRKKNVREIPLPVRRRSITTSAKQ